MDLAVKWSYWIQTWRADSHHKPVFFFLRLACRVAVDNILEYVKAEYASAGNHNYAQPTFDIEASWKEAKIPGEKKIEIPGGSELFVQIEVVPEADLPLRVEGSSTVSCQQQGTWSIHFAGQERSGRC